MDKREVETPAFWSSPAGVALLVALAAAGFYLVAEHRAHVYGILPYLFLLACPLMHLFMHHGHGGHGHRQHDDRSPGERDEQPRT